MLCVPDSVTQETHKAVTQRVQSLEESESKLKVEASRLKEVAEVASHQTEAIKSQQESQDKELTSLRKQLYDMQMESDDKTIIGQCVELMKLLFACLLYNRGI